MKDLYFEIEEDGYHIYDSNDPLFHIHQYEPYIPCKEMTYEENAQRTIRSIMILEYAFAVCNEEIAIEDVPEEYRETVISTVAEMKNVPEEPDTPNSEIEEKAQAYDILMGVSE